MKSYLFIICVAVLLMPLGCVTTQSMHDKTTDPVTSNQIGRKLRTQEDIDYWKKIKNNNESAVVVLDDP